MIGPTLKNRMLWLCMFLALLVPCLLLFAADRACYYRHFLSVLIPVFAGFEVCSIEHFITISVCVTAAYEALSGLQQQLSH
jgi:hypothetical protein